MISIYYKMDQIIEEINNNIQFYENFIEIYMKEVGKMKNEYNSFQDKRKEDARDLQKRINDNMNIIGHYQSFISRLNTIISKILVIQYNELNI